jgi:phosphatidate cytidylyltransferase
VSDSELTTRTLVALAMGPIFFAAIFIGGVVFFLFVAALAGRALWELPALFRVTDESTPLRALSLPVALLLLGDAWLGSGAHWGVILLGGTGLVLLVEIFRPDDTAPTVVLGGSLTGWLYITLPLAHLLWLRGAEGLGGSLPAGGAWLVMSMWGIIWVADTAAYFVGRKIGRTKLLPSVSPAKSWEGFGAELLSGAMMGAILALCIPVLDWSIIGGAAIGALIGLVATIGDLAESRLKRAVGVKDVSGILPGHGGFLDRFDSTIFCAPVLYWILSAWSQAAGQV